MKYFAGFLLLLIGCGAANAARSLSDSEMLGQKMILDFRYFCADNTPAATCRQPVTELTPALADILTSGAIGGVILFSENIRSVAQVVKFNYQLQKLMHDNNLPPLFIAIDQEGGRVARIPDAMATRYVGNMAIGASYAAYDTEFATQVANGLANSLRLLGFNVNFAPSIDVNSNPHNPVINVRSYGESPTLVAELGIATIAALQKQQIVSAVKHFPGHGDTSVDSHTGLPKVEHSLAHIKRADLLPFVRAIKSATPPQMIMSAHIQYPALDDTKVTSRTGEEIALPATLSKKILTGLLRNQLGYTGLIVTDALDMAGIAQYFTPSQALVQTFSAGADIALMPFSIRNPDDIHRFNQIRQHVLGALASGALSHTEFTASAARILALKEGHAAGQFLQQSLLVRQARATAALPSAAQQATELALAQAALTQLFNTKVLPLDISQRIAAIMPDTARCHAFTAALTGISPAIKVQCYTSLLASDMRQTAGWQSADIVVLADITPVHSVAETGGLDNPATLAGRISANARQQWQYALLKQAKTAGKKTVFVSMRAPYQIRHYEAVSDAALATFGYNVQTLPHKDAQRTTARGAVFEALAQGLYGKIPLTGRSPVTIPLRQH
ncbi:glycoside hydrolase family 3 protein [Salinimonas sediminis]|uniref:beta-N-acetylhexosaminidase n=1 Tax=Salinimonas sediminis TaxID=2303538 RepID=A0A346NIB5_9ALTE|nr:glycoside hydrolase family 3 N-terminal domain-containing protein [Salinimonas sediminis]AXR05272.1 hypothetical protein D0Y50_02120 [Salinimonas sediminis]